MKRAMAPPQREKTMTKMITSSVLTMVPLVEMVMVQLVRMGVTNKIFNFVICYYLNTL